MPVIDGRVRAETFLPAVERMLGVSLTLLSVTPTSALWSELLFFPLQFMIRGVRRAREIGRARALV
jgi:hypothetical protein